MDSWRILHRCKPKNTYFTPTITEITNKSLHTANELYTYLLTYQKHCKDRPIVLYVYSNYIRVNLSSFKALFHRRFVNDYSSVFVHVFTDTSVVWWYPGTKHVDQSLHEKMHRKDV